MTHLLLLKKKPAPIILGTGRWVVPRNLGERRQKESGTDRIPPWLHRVMNEKRTRLECLKHSPRGARPTCHSSHQSVNASRLSGPTGPQGHHAVSDRLRLKQLDYLQLPGRVIDQACVLNLRERRLNVNTSAVTRTGMTLSGQHILTHRKKTLKGFTRIFRRHVRR